MTSSVLLWFLICLWYKKWAGILKMGMLQFEGLNAFPNASTHGRRSAFAQNPGCKHHKLIFTGLRIGYNLYLQIPMLFFNNYFYPLESD